MQRQDEHYFVYIFGDQPQQDVEVGMVNGQQQRAAWVQQNPRAKQSKLVYYEHYQAEDEARNRESQIKSSGMDKVKNLVASMNPNWLDLRDTLED